MKNMNWEQFLTEFVLRAMTNNIHEQYFSPKDAASRARDVWDAIQAAELPESERAKQLVIAANSPDLIPSNSMELKALAQLAAAQGFAWIAQDKCGVWYGYKIKPEFREQLQEWRSKGNNHWAALNLPDNTDYSKQIFNVKTILDNE